MFNNLEIMLDEDSNIESTDNRMDDYSLPIVISIDKNTEGLGDK